jgi:hypothetical protein
MREAAGWRAVLWQIVMCGIQRSRSSCKSDVQSLHQLGSRVVLPIWARSHRTSLGELATPAVSATHPARRRFDPPKTLYGSVPERGVANAASAS